MRFLLLTFFLTIVQAGFPQPLIKNTNVADVENKKMLVGYNVVVLDGKIISVDKDKQYKLPQGTEVTDGSGKRLVPGFTDAHVHFFQSPGILPAIQLTTGRRSPETISHLSG